MLDVPQNSQRQLRFGYPAIYSIRVIGCLEKRWSNRFSDLTIQMEDAVLTDGVVMTTLTGNFIDQAALMGILNTLYNLRLMLWSVECLGLPRSS